MEQPAVSGNLHFRVAKHVLAAAAAASHQRISNVEYQLSVR